MRTPNLVLLTPPGSSSCRLSVGSRLRDRCGETDSFTALAPPLARSLSHPVTDLPPLSSPDSYSRCPDWFWFLKCVRECVDVSTNAPACVQNEMRASIKQGENKEAQPDHCTETESRRDWKRTEGLWECWRAQQESGAHGSSVSPPPYVFFPLLNTEHTRGCTLSHLNQMHTCVCLCRVTDVLCVCIQILHLAGGLERLTLDCLSNSVVREIQDIIRSYIEEKWLPHFLSTAEFSERQQQQLKVDRRLTHSQRAVLKHIETWLDGPRTWLVYLPADRQGAAGLKHQKGLDWLCPINRSEVVHVPPFFGS